MFLNQMVLAFLDLRLESGLIFSWSLYSHIDSHTPSLHMLKLFLCCVCINSSALVSSACLELDLSSLHCSWCLVICPSFHLFISHPSLLRWVLVESMNLEKEKLSPNCSLVMSYQPTDSVWIWVRISLGFEHINRYRDRIMNGWIDG